MHKALELDPTYALAWAGLADAYSLLGYYGNVHPEEARTKAHAAVVEALRHGPDLAEAHSARGLQALLFEWDWPTAERSFLKALELNPGYVQAAAWFHLFYRGFACGRWTDVVVALQEWAARDPRSAYLAAVLAIAYAGHSTDSEMERWIRRAEELDPDAFLTLWARQLTTSAMQDAARGIEAGQAALAASGRHVFPLLILGLDLARQGDAEGARAVYDEARSRARRGVRSADGLRAARGRAW